MARAQPSGLYPIRIRAAPTTTTRGRPLEEGLHTYVIFYPRHGGVTTRPMGHADRAGVDKVANEPRHTNALAAGRLAPPSHNL